jgi:hypothetical protein
MSNDIQSQLNEAFELETKPTSPNSTLAILWMDTGYRLAERLLQRENNIRAADKKPMLVPGMSDLHNSMQYIGSFDSFFQLAEDGPDGRPDYRNPHLDRNKNSMGSIAYNMFSDTTSKLISHAHELKGVNLAITAAGIIKERQTGEIFIPDETGPDMSDFAQPIASKIVFYGFKLMSLLRANGGSKRFGPKSQSSITDILNLKDVEINDLEEVQDDPKDIDHMEMSWDITQSVILAPENVYNLSGVELQEVTTLKAVFDAWMAVYDSLEDKQDKLEEEVEYAVSQAKAFVEQQRKESNSPVTGVVKSA